MAQQWDELLGRYRQYLRLERSLASATVEAYVGDVCKLAEHLRQVPPEEVDLPLLEDFLRELRDTGIGLRTQARLVSAIRSFFSFLVMEETIADNPALLLELPRTGRKLPEVLTVEEIERILDAVDLSRPGGHRDRAILEVMYGCGLRVSEVTTLRISNIFAGEGFVRILGKGSKERLVPIHRRALRAIELYLTDRRQQETLPQHSDILFLNLRGHPLSRVYIFQMVKDLARKAGIQKNISPHTFRHSFATHLMEGGADLRAIQQMLGHESIQTTEIYTHLDKEYLRSTLLDHHPRA